MSSPPTSDVGFVQQGQVDWVAFGKTIVPLTIDVLARLQGAGVQPITYAGALQLTTSFSLPERGQQRLWDVINRLKCYNSASNLLYFGFGHRSFFRILTETVSGLKCIALCSCLAEMHSEPVAARILSALWHELGYPEDFEPSIPQFRALIKACGGALASSPFPEIANRMFPSVRDLKADDKCSDPKDVAKALTGLFDISMGRKKSIAIVGGGDGAFIAAVAYWIFNMSIYVEDCDGNTVFSSSVTNLPVQSDSAQVYVRFADLEQNHGIAISQSTYLLNDPKDLLHYMPSKQFLHLRRRVPWDRCLKDTFGSAFDDFMKLPTAVWKFLGSFARISMALAEGEADVGDYSRQDFIDFAEASNGQGFVDSCQTLFPELSGPDLRNKMQSVLSIPFTEAKSYQEESILAFQRSCSCGLCNSQLEAAPICFVVLAATLVDLIVTVSPLQFEVESQLHPTPHGIRLFYKRNSDRHRLNSRTQRKGWRTLFHRGSRYDVIDRPTVNPLGVLVEDVLSFFTGASFEGGESLVLAEVKSNSRIAICGSGICVFIHGMVSISTRADLLRRIHVIPGRIGRKDLRNPNAVCHEYDSVLDIANWPEPIVARPQFVAASNNRPFVPTASGQQSSNSSHSADSRPPTGEALHRSKPNSAPEKLNLTPEVVESGDAGEITFFYRVSTSSGDILLPPGKITTGILESTGLVSCKKSGHCKSCAEPPELFTAKDGWFMDDKEARELNLTSPICLQWEHLKNSELGRLAAFAAQYQTEFTVLPKYRSKTIIMRRGECLQCCSHYIVAQHRVGRDKTNIDTHRGIYHLI
jgi:hypothetical protein